MIEVFGFQSAIHRSTTYWFGTWKPNTSITTASKRRTPRGRTSAANASSKRGRSSTSKRSRPAEEIEKNQVTLEGQLDPDNLPTEYWYEYGPDDSYGLSTKKPRSRESASSRHPSSSGTSRLASAFTTGWSPATARTVRPQGRTWSYAPPRLRRSRASARKTFRNERRPAPKSRSASTPNTSSNTAPRSRTATRFPAREKTSARGLNRFQRTPPHGADPGRDRPFQAR